MLRSVDVTVSLSEHLGQTVIIRSLPHARVARPQDTPNRRVDQSAADQTRPYKPPSLHAPDAPSTLTAPRALPLAPARPAAARARKADPREYSRALHRLAWAVGQRSDRASH